MCDAYQIGVPDSFRIINCGSESAVPLWHGKELLETELRSLLQNGWETLNSCEFIRVQARVIVDDIDDTILWLRGQSAMPKLFYSDPELRLVAAGAGSAHTLNGPGSLSQFPLLGNISSEFRYYGGERFDQASDIADEWALFGGHYFVLPRMELVRTRDTLSTGKPAVSSLDSELHAMAKQFCLAVNIHVSNQRPDALRENLQEALRCVEGMARPWKRGSCPVPHPCATELGTAWEQWRAAVDGALEQMRAGALSKVVLARSCLVRLTSAVDPLDVLLRLRPAGSYRFLLQPAVGGAFLGCSPERLFRSSGGVVETVAMAGTCPRGATAAEDAALAEGLLRSAKDARENSVTADYIARALAAHADGVTTGDLFVAKHRHVQHLCRTITAALRPSLRAAGAAGEAGALLRCLSPTPAVCGESRDAAAAWIRRAEPRDRGFYSGPFGVVSAGASEFTVAIRSALCLPDPPAAPGGGGGGGGGGGCRALRVYGGAGIVPGSEALAEWEETALKMRAVLQALPADPPPPSPRLAPRARAAPPPRRGACAAAAGEAGGAGGAGVAGAVTEASRVVRWAEWWGARARERVERAGLLWLVQLVACCCLGETIFRADPGLFLLF